MGKRGWIGGLLALGLATSVLAQLPSQKEDAAAKALARQDYPAVVSLYKGVPEAELSDRAWYRLAIARFKTGDRPAAAEALGRALKLNPDGKFASSPERLQAWIKEIGPVPPAPELTPPVAASSPAESAAPVPPASAPVNAPGAVPAEASAAVAPTTAKEPVAAVPASAPGQSVASPTPSTSDAGLWSHVVRALTWFAEAPLFWAVCAVTWLCALVVFVRAFRAARNRKVTGLDSRAQQQSRALFQRLQDFRAEANYLHGAIRDAGRTDSDLYSSLSVLLKALDGEIGRACYHGTLREDLLVPADAATLEVISRLRTGPIRLSQSTGEQVQQLFQTSRRTL